MLIFLKLDPFWKLFFFLTPISTRSRWEESTRRTSWKSWRMFSNATPASLKPYLSKLDIEAEWCGTNDGGHQMNHNTAIKEIYISDCRFELVDAQSFFRNNWQSTQFLFHILIFFYLLIVFQIYNYFNYHFFCYIFCFYFYL